MAGDEARGPAGGVVKPPKFVKGGQWQGYRNPVWHKRDKHKVTPMFNYIERRKSFFMRAYVMRQGLDFIDMGDHVKEDVSWGKLYGNRMQCNPTYFTSGSILRNLHRLHQETGLSKKEISERYLFVCGGGQCGPCRYGMYPQEYYKALNDAGYEDFRILIFSSDLGDDSISKESAMQFNLNFRINIMIGSILADLMHIAECTLRPYARDKDQLTEVLGQAEEILLEAFKSRLYLARLPSAIRRCGELFSTVETHDVELPLIYVTGEAFANLAHNDGNYNLRRFIIDEGCAVVPGLFTQRMIFDNWRRCQEAGRALRYVSGTKQRIGLQRFIVRQNVATACINYTYKSYRRALESTVRWRSCDEILDLDRLTRSADPYYNHEIFGGESNLEIGEAIYYSGKVEGFISCKPFGCIPSSGVSDGVLSKIMHLYPDLNFLSIETSGDNEVNILSRVSMLLFKAKQHFIARKRAGDRSARERLLRERASSLGIARDGSG